MNGGSSNQAFGSDGYNPDIDSIFSKFKGMDFYKYPPKTILRSPDYFKNFSMRNIQIQMVVKLKNRL